MTLLSSLALSPNSLSPQPSDAAATAAAARRGARVRAVEYLPPVGDPLQERARQTAERQAGARQPQNQRAIARRPEDERPRGLGAPQRPEAGGLETAASAQFLVQVFGQDQAPHPIALAAHRDAAVLGSDAYRRAGATPPVYSEQPTLFRIAI